MFYRCGNEDSTACSKPVLMPDPNPFSLCKGFIKVVCSALFLFMFNLKPLYPYILRVLVAQYWGEWHVYFSHPCSFTSPARLWIFDGQGLYANYPTTSHTNKPVPEWMNTHKYIGWVCYLFSLFSQICHSFYFLWFLHAYQCLSPHCESHEVGVLGFWWLVYSWNLAQYPAQGKY